MALRHCRFKRPTSFLISLFTFISPFRNPNTVRLVHVRHNPCVRSIDAFHWRAKKKKKSRNDSINKVKNLGDSTRCIFELNNLAKGQVCAVHSHDNNCEKCFTQFFRASLWRSSNMATVTQQKHLSLIFTINRRLYHSRAWTHRNYYFVLWHTETDQLAGT